MLKIPNFFIVGAPKSGTTALYEYLRPHPEVYMASKEIYFFGRDFHYLHPRPSLAYYQSLFANAPASASALGDASVWYLYSTTAAREIYDFNPAAKVIILLRNPYTMLPSLHSQQVYSGNENITDFALALAAEPQRRQGQQIPPLIGSPIEALYYSEVAKYSAQVQRYFDIFGKKNVKVLIFEDFIADIPYWYKEVLAFLSLSTAFRPESFQQINPKKQVKSARFRDFLKQRSPWKIQLAKWVLPSRALRQKVEDTLWQWNTRPAPKETLSPDIQQQLKRYFAEDIDQVSLLLQKNLSTLWQSP